MHKSREVDDVLSGTTAVTVLVKDGTLFVGNVGDSRAIIASEDQMGKLK
jgi:serine/threonine protein phosphatase PrpC